MRQKFHSVPALFGEYGGMLNTNIYQVQQHWMRSRNLLVLKIGENLQKKIFSLRILL